MSDTIDTSPVLADGPAAVGADLRRTPQSRLDADPRRWKALGVLALVQFMLVLDATVVNVALSHIQSDLHFSRSGLAWVVDGYILTAGGLLLFGGKLGDLLGRRRLFLAGVVVFALASAASGAAVDPGMLVASRFVQGVGEALASPAAFGLIAILFSDSKERAKAIGMFGGVAGLGGTLGPIISGLLISAVSWRWIFFVNVPVALFALVAVVRLVDDSRADRPLVPPAGPDPTGRGSGTPVRTVPDVAGAALATGGLVGIVYGLIEAATVSWGSLSVVGPLVLGAVALALFVLRERSAGDPLIPAQFLSNRTRVTGNLATVFFSAVFLSVVYLLTLYWEQVQHYSALRTGLAYLPLGISIGIGISLASTLVARVGVRVLLGSGSVLFAGGVALTSRISVRGSYLGEAVPALVLLGLGAGVEFASFGNAALDKVSGQDAGLASGVQATSQQVGSAIGIAVLATLALREARHLTAHGVAAAAASTHGTVLAFRIGAVMALVSGVLVAFMPADAGRDVPPPED